MTSPKLKIETWPVDKVINYARNARLHSEDQVKAIAASITEFGFINPCLVDPDGVLIAGHGRVLASKQLGHKTVPVIRLGHLTEIQIKALRVADNQLATTSTWSEELLRLELTDLSLAGYDMPLLGFDDVQLVSFLANVPSDNDPEATPEVPAIPVTRTGDVWQLGEHLLVCGDALLHATSVVENHKINCALIDPPYGMRLNADFSGILGSLGRKAGTKGNKYPCGIREKKLSLKPLGPSLNCVGPSRNINAESYAMIGSVFFRPKMGRKRAIVCIQLKNQQVF